MNDSYRPPVSRLLALGKEPAHRRIWPNYLHLGLQPAHVPELIRMAGDRSLLDAEERSRESWAPLHAWRALGQLEAAAAAAPLFALLEREANDPDVFAEVPVVLGMIGPPSLPEATLWLFDETRDERIRVGAIRVLAEVGHEYPERSHEAAAILVQQLNDWAHQTPELNGFLVAALAELGESGAAPLIEEVFAAGKVARWISGEWEDVQVELGLREPDETEPPAYDLDGYVPGPARTPGADAAGSARARRKAAKQARKRNRKRK